jgi:hypothetical protein
MNLPFLRIVFGVILEERHHLLDIARIIGGDDQYFPLQIIALDHLDKNILQCIACVGSKDMLKAENDLLVLPGL